MSESGAYLVDGVGREYMGVAGDCLVRLGGLKALVERAAIRDTSEDAGNEDRIIGVAEADEDLVLLLRVEVAADVELVAMLEQGRAVAVRLEAGVRRREQVEHFDRVLDRCGPRSQEAG